jgi:hypothetical protein
VTLSLRLLKLFGVFIATVSKTMKRFINAMRGVTFY